MVPLWRPTLHICRAERSCSLVQAKTGTGKTLAFLLPAIQNTLQNSPSKGQVAILVMSPTRELALQIAAEAERLLKKFRRPIEVHTAFGGTAKASSLTKFKQGDPKILVATPVSIFPFQLHISLLVSHPQGSLSTSHASSRVIMGSFLFRYHRNVVDT